MYQYTTTSSGVPRKVREKEMRWTECRTHKQNSNAGAIIDLFPIHFEYFFLFLVFLSSHSRIIFRVPCHQQPGQGRCVYSLSLSQLKQKINTYRMRVVVMRMSESHTGFKKYNFNVCGMRKLSRENADY